MDESNGIRSRYSITNALSQPSEFIGRGPIPSVTDVLALVSNEMSIFKRFARVRTSDGVDHRLGSMKEVEIRLMDDFVERSKGGNMVDKVGILLEACIPLLAFSDRCWFWKG